MMRPRHGLWFCIDGRVQCLWLTKLSVLEFLFSCFLDKAVVRI